MTSMVVVQPNENATTLENVPAPSQSRGHGGRVQARGGAGWVHAASRKYGIIFGSSRPPYSGARACTNIC